MRRLYNRYIFTAICVEVFVVRSASAELKAGAAAVAITPEYDIWLSGYAARTAPSAGKLHDIYTKALAFEDERGTRLVLVTLDLIGVYPELIDAVMARVQPVTGLSREAFLFNASHSHCGPLLPDRLIGIHDPPPEQWDRAERYASELEEKLARVVVNALDRLEPVRIYRSTGRATFAMNRREYTLTGIVGGVNPIGPVDHDVPLMSIVDKTGTVKAIVFGYACHATTLDIQQINGDYPGFAQAYLERENPGAVALFFAGCGADCNPFPRHKIELAERYGRELAQAVQAAMERPLREITGPIYARYATIDLPLTPCPNRSELENRFNSTTTKHLKRCFQLLLDRYDCLGGMLPEIYPYPIQVWRLGEIERKNNERQEKTLNIVALGGEVVVDYALRLKYELGGEQTWVMGYCNDVMAYIPSLRVLREGGYEADTTQYEYGLHGPWRPELETMIVHEVQRSAKD